MARSRRKRPFAALCGGSQKKDKRICNRIMRRTARVALSVHGEEALFLRHDEALSVYSMSQDGSRRYRPYTLRHWPYEDYYRWYRWVLAK